VPGNHKSLSPFTETIGADSPAQGGKFNQTQIFSTMKNKKKQRERLGQTSFERPVEYLKPSKSGMETMNVNGVPKSVEKWNGKRSVNGDSEEKSPRKKIKKNDSPKAKKTTSNVNGDSVSKESSGKNAISQLFSDHSRLLPGTKRQAMTKNYSNSAP
jgi:hypothetical protein